MISPQKEITYCDHLTSRLSLRKISSNLPKEIIRQPAQVFKDNLTGYQIAVGRAFHDGRDRLMMVAYEESESEILAITIHPLDERELESKMKSGRWIP